MDRCRDSVNNCQTLSQNNARSLFMAIEEGIVVCNSLRIIYNTRAAVMKDKIMMKLELYYMPKMSSDKTTKWMWVNHCSLHQRSSNPGLEVWSPEPLDVTLFQHTGVKWLNQLLSLLLQCPANNLMFWLRCVEEKIYLKLAGHRPSSPGFCFTLL